MMGNRCGTCVPGHDLLLGKPSNRANAVLQRVLHFLGGLRSAAEVSSA